MKQPQNLISELEIWSLDPLPEYKFDTTQSNRRCGALVFSQYWRDELQFKSVIMWSKIISTLSTYSDVTLVCYLDNCSYDNHCCRWRHYLGCGQVKDSDTHNTGFFIISNNGGHVYVCCLVRWLACLEPAWSFSEILLLVLQSSIWSNKV